MLFRSDCDNEIAYAQQMATEYSNLIVQQQAEIEQLEAERIAAEAAEPVTLPDLSEERPVCDPEAPNPNPVEAGPAVAPKDENGKFDPTKIADVSDFGDWEEQGCKG